MAKKEWKSDEMKKKKRKWKKWKWNSKLTKNIKKLLKNAKKNKKNKWVPILKYETRKHRGSGNTEREMETLKKKESKKRGGG